MTTIAKGSGFTTRDIVSVLQRKLAEDFVGLLEGMGMGGPRKRDERDAHRASFTHGMKAMLHRLEQMGIVTVLADTPRKG